MIQSDLTLNAKFAIDVIHTIEMLTAIMLCLLHGLNIKKKSDLICAASLESCL